MYLNAPIISIPLSPDSLQDLALSLPPSSRDVHGISERVWSLCRNNLFSLHHQTMYLNLSISIDIESTSLRAPRLSIPSGSSININTKSFDKLVQARKEQSVKVAMEELSMEGEGVRASKKKRISDSDATLIWSPYVQVTIDDKEINMLWANNSSVLRMELTDPWYCFHRFVQ